MRTDLSPAFIAAKDSATRRPRQLMVFNFPGAGVVRVSDQALGAPDGLIEEYSALVEDWGELLDMAGGDPMDYTAGEIRQSSIVLWNGGATPFSDYFLAEDPENVTVELYQWFASPRPVLIAGGGCVVTGTTAQKTVGIPAFDSEVRSQSSLTGYAVARFSTNQTNARIMAGLNSDPQTNMHYAGIDYALYARNTGAVEIWESGVSRGTFGTYTTDSVFEVVYDGSAINYLVDGVEIRSVAMTAGLTFYFDSSFYDVGGELRDIAFSQLRDADMALIDTFVVQDPIAFDEVSRLLHLDLVSLSMRHDNPLGDLITAETWPNAAQAAIGKGLPLIIGTPGEIPTLYAKAAPETTLNGSILDTTMTINVNGDLDDLAFAAAGTLQLGEELIRYSSRTASSFAVLQRGYLSAASEHLDRDKVVQKIEDHTFLAGKGPIYAINSVKVGGFAAPVEIYTVDPASDPARVVFSEKPYSYRFAEASTFLEMQFDFTNGDNTAYQAYLAYDAADQATAAKISPLYPALSLQQTTANQDRGEIVKAYLAVEHWESDRFLSDYVEVWVEGIGIVGNLSRPNQADAVAVDAEIDIDHGHTKTISGEHTHSFTNPNYNINDPAHGHATTATADTAYNPYDLVPSSLSAPYGASGTSKYFHFLSTPNSFVNGRLTISTSLNLATMNIEIGWGIAGSDYVYRASPIGPADMYENTITIPGTYNIGLGARTNPNPGVLNCLVVRLSAYGNVYGATAAANSMQMSLTLANTITPALTGTVAALSTGGVNAARSANDISIDPLATANQPLQNVEAEAATRTIINLFDLTSYVNLDWAWFTGRDVKLTYRGTVDAKDVFIVHCFFDVEFRKRERVFSDEVTCEPVGLIDDESGTYTGTPGAVITRPDHVRKYILCQRGGMPTAYIDSANFAAAGTTFDSIGYAFNGLLDASMTVREAEKKLAWQCRSRFFWNAGKAKIALRKKILDQLGCKALTVADYRLRSISAQRQRVADLINSITLFYSRQWTSADAGTAGFGSSVAGLNNASIGQHGTLENRDLFTFDLVTGETMANDLLAFYLENLAYPSTFYAIDTYLSQFDLEKEDCITLTTPFNRLRKANMVIRAADRAFGSGKLRRINYIRIVAESLRYILLDQTINDTVTVFDSLTVTIGLPGFFNDSIFLSDDQVFALIVIGAVETVSVAEALQIIFRINHTIAETATVGEELACHFHVPLADSLTITENLVVPVFTSGFGGGGFGEVNFGGSLVSVVNPLDEAMLSEVLAAAVGAILTDTATATDETIIFSAGFGGPTIGAGYGASPFGR